MLCSRSLFCFVRVFVHSRHFIEDIIPQPVCQSAEKAGFIFSLQHVLKWNRLFQFHIKVERPVSPYLTLQNSVCLSCGKLWSYVCARLQNSIPGLLIGCATGLRDLCPTADVVWMHSVNVWPVSQVLQPYPTPPPPPPPSPSSINHYEVEAGSKRIVLEES